MGLGINSLLVNPLLMKVSVSGMLIPLIMPVDVPLLMVAVAVTFVVVIGKEVFGGTGMNIVNIALTLERSYFAYPSRCQVNLDSQHWRS